MEAKYGKVGERKKIHDWTCSLEPAAIQFMLKHLQESARQSGCSLLAIFKHSMTSIIRTPLCQFHQKSVQIIVRISSLKYKVVIKYSNKTYTTLIEHSFGVKYSNRTVSRTVWIIEVLLYLYP